MKRLKKSAQLKRCERQKILEERRHKQQLALVKQIELQMTWLRQVEQQVAWVEQVEQQATWMGQTEQQLALIEQVEQQLVLVEQIEQQTIWVEQFKKPAWLEQVEQTSQLMKPFEKTMQLMEQIEQQTTMLLFDFLDDDDYLIEQDVLHDQQYQGFVEEYLPPTELEGSNNVSSDDSNEKQQAISATQHPIPKEVFDEIVYCVSEKVIKYFEMKEQTSAKTKDTFTEQRISKSTDETLIKQIGALAMLLAEAKGQRYKKGEKPNASQISEDVLSMLEELDCKNLKGFKGSLGKNISLGIKQLF